MKEIGEIIKDSFNFMGWIECNYCNHMCSPEIITSDCYDNHVCTKCVEDEYIMRNLP